MPLDTAACTSGVGEEDIYNDGEGLIDSRRMVLPSFPPDKTRFNSNKRLNERLNDHKLFIR